MTHALIAIPLLAAVQTRGFEAPPGFEVERVSELAESFLGLGFGPSGRLFLGVEDGPILWVRDADGDGRFESHGTYSTEVKGSQGLLWFQDRLWATGRRDGEEGLFRLTPSADGERAEEVEPVLLVTPGGEHGIHGLAAGPDGAIYLAIGDHATVRTPPAASLALADGYEGNLLPDYTDPNGHGLHCKYPHGIVAKVDPKDGTWTMHSAGYRNFCHLAFDASGELFTADSDMEWDLGLPWYRPVRVIDCVPGGDFGSRRGSSVWPDWYPDSLPGIADIGRGSPTGIAIVSDARFPTSLQGALLVGDWSQGRILGVHLEPSGAASSGGIETLLSAQGACPITDLAFGPDGALYFTTGGRGVIGEVQRLVYRGGGAAAATRPKSAWRRPVPAPGADPYASLGDPDRWVRFAARTALEHAPPADLARRVLAEADPVRTVEGALALARARPPGAAADPLLEKLAGLLEDAGRRSEVLRAIEVVLLRLGEPAPAARAKLAARLAALFPDRDARSSRELAVLLAHLDPERAIEPLLSALAAEPDREQSIHYAFCLSAIENGFTAATARAAFRWFEAAQAWSGGSSFAGYLAAMRDRVLSRLGPAEVAGVASSEETGARTLAFLLSRRAEAAPSDLAGVLAKRFAALGDGADADSARLDVVRTLSGSKSPGSLAILREACLGSPPVRDAAISALADAASPDDADRFLGGLSSPSPELPFRCAQALAKIGWRPAEPAAFASALDAAHRLGSGRARPMLEILLRTADLPPLGPVPATVAARADEYKRGLESLEAWFRAKHPEVKREPSEVGRGPHWGYDRILAFLSRSSARPGSPARGRDVFVRATCVRCHVLQGDAQGGAADPAALSGPDLTTVSRRFDDAALLESILFPSRAISDSFRNTVVATDEDESIEGRVVVEDAASLTLLLSDGSRRTVERRHVVSTRPSELSPMPEGLLAASTLEEVKDLLAFLRAEGRIDPADAARPGWIPALVGPQRSGWTFDPAVWRAPGGVLVGRGAKLERSSYFLSKASHSDFEIEFDVRLPTGNSGFQYRSTVDPKKPDPDGYQADIGQGYWGSLYVSDGRGIASQADPKAWVPVLDREGWNHFFVHVEGDRHVIELNGLVTTDFRDAAFASGVLGFQVHERMDMEVRFANVRLRDLR